MGETLSQLGQLLVQTIPTIILVIFLLYFLDRMFFRPLTAKLEEREAATTGALEKARQLTVEAEEKLRRYEDLLQKARVEIYHKREEARKQALAEQEETLAKARAQGERFLQEAHAGIAAEARNATAEIRKAIEPLAREITNLAVNVQFPDDWEGAIRK